MNSDFSFTLSLDMNLIKNGSKAELWIFPKFKKKHWKVIDYMMSHTEKSKNTFKKVEENI